HLHDHLGLAVDVGRAVEHFGAHAAEVLVAIAALDARVLLDEDLVTVADQFGGGRRDEADSAFQRLQLAGDSDAHEKAPLRYPLIFANIRNNARPGPVSRGTGRASSWIPPGNHTPRPVVARISGGGRGSPRNRRRPGVRPLKTGNSPPNRCR